MSEQTQIIEKQESTQPMCFDVRSMWAKILEVYPALQSIDCIFDAEDTSLMQFMPGPPPKLFFPENADLNVFREFLSSRPLSCDLVCKQLGIQKEVLTPEFLRSFIFLHECGHAHDFIVNFSNFSKLDHPENSFARFEDACMRCNERQEYELKKLPIPVTPAGFLASRREYPQFLEQLIMEYLQKQTLSQEDYASVFDTLERAYKNLPSEKYADEFAERFMRDNDCTNLKK